MNRNYYFSLRFIAVMLLSFCTLSVYSQWTKQTAPRERHLYGAQIKNYGEFIVIGGNLFNDSLRDVLLTTDNGQNWVPVDSPPYIAPWYQDVSFPSAQTGYLVGYNGTIKKTTDGGLNWTQIRSVPGLAKFRHYNAVHFIDDNNGYIVGGWITQDSVQTILRTTDGGASWSVQRDNLGFILNEVYMVNSTIAYAVGANGGMYKTTDGGSNWNPLSLPGNTSGRSFNAIYFHSATEGIAVGGNKENDSIRTIIRTIDGGANWDVIADTISPWLNDINFVNPNLGYAVGDRGSVLTTTNGGQSWSPVSISVNDTSNLNGIEIFNQDYMMLVGDFGKILINLSINPTLPTTITEAPTHIRDSSAVLNGTVNANGSTATVTFEYGTTLAFGHTLAANPNIVAGSTNTGVSAQLQFTDFDAMYYYTVKAVSAGGTVYGDTMQFYSGHNIPNWDFEYWDTVTRVGPEIWGSMGDVSQVTSYNSSIAARILGGTINDAGVLLLGMVDNNGPSGGVPFAARPDSIKGYFNYDIVAGDSAIILLVFKTNGVIVSQNMFTIGGSSGGTFVPLSFPITYSAPDMPDSMILGVTSSNFNTITNPNSVLIVDDLSFSGTTLAIPNGDMEDWDTLSSVYLSDWESSMSRVPYIGEIFYIERTTDRVHGNYAVKVKNDVVGQPNFPTNLNAGSQQYGFPIDIRHNTFHGYMKWAPQGTDTLFVQLNLKKNGVYIGGQYTAFTSAINDWQAFTMDIAYQSPDVPDTAEIRISLGNFTPTGNSVAYFDYLSFDGLRDTSNTNPIGVQEDLLSALRDIYFKVYPNPTDGKICLEFFNGQNTANNSQLAYTIFDISGKLVYTESESGTGNGIVKKQLDMSGLQPGVYFINITGSTLNKTMKVVVQ